MVGRTHHDVDDYTAEVMVVRVVNGGVDDKKQERKYGEKDREK